MANLNENWEASRPLIFKTILLLEGSDSVSPLCGLCHQKQWLIRCVECGGKTVCPACDAVVHDKLVFHNREAFLDGAFRHIPSTLKFNENGQAWQAWQTWASPARPGLPRSWPGLPGKRGLEKPGKPGYRSMAFPATLKNRPAFHGFLGQKTRSRESQEFVTMFYK